MKRIIVRGGVIITANQTFAADLVIEGEKITQIAPNIIATSNEQVINATDRLIFPGGIDPHVHFHLKTNAGFSADDFETGSKAALAGGTTSIIDFVTPENGEQLKHALDNRLIDAVDCMCDYSFHITPLSWSPQIEQEMQACVELGFTSFKIYMAYLDTIGINRDTLEQVLTSASKLNTPVAIHAEDGIKIAALQRVFRGQNQKTPKYHALSRPPIVETEAVAVAIALAEKTNATIYFVHISAAESLQLIANAQGRGLKVFAETCPHYLIFDNRKLTDDFEASAPFVFSPALHAPYHKKWLWKAIADGTIQTIGTDHCPFNMHTQKVFGINDFTKIPNGTGGVQHRLELLYHFGVKKNKISLNKLVDITATAPARIFELTNKGSIQVGYDADFVIFNPNSKHTISAAHQFQNCDHNIYEGITLDGKVETVFLRGQKAFENDQHFPVKGNLINRRK